MAIERTRKHDRCWWDAILVPSTTLNCGSEWCSLFCCANSGQAWVEVCCILHLVTIDVDSRLECFLLSGGVQTQAGNFCVDYEIQGGTMKYIGKKYYTLWNDESSLKYIRKKHYVLLNIHEYRDSRNNTYPTILIPLNYHQVSSWHLILSFPRLWAIQN